MRSDNELCVAGPGRREGLAPSQCSRDGLGLVLARAGSMELGLCFCPAFLSGATHRAGSAGSSDHLRRLAACSLGYGLGLGLVERLLLLILAGTQMTSVDACQDGRAEACGLSPRTAFSEAERW